MKRTAGTNAVTSMQAYCEGIRRYPLLTVACEQSLARAYRRKGDARAAHQLVTANLRFVIKVANQYRAYGLSMADLIQEGNIGLMKAVQRFDPDRGVRLISYAVWWIRAYVQNYILGSFSLVKLGTTQAQRKLFYSLARAKRELDRLSDEHGPGSDGEDPARIAKKLNVKTSEVEEMTLRMVGHDLSLDASPSGDRRASHLDSLVGDLVSPEHEVADAQQRRMTQSRVADALARLDERERYIVERRLMGDEHVTLKELGRHFGFSRERARQLELRAREKLKRELHTLEDLDDGSAADPIRSGTAATRPLTIQRSLTA